MDKVNNPAVSPSQPRAIHETLRSGDTYSRIQAISSTLLSLTQTDGRMHLETK